MKTTLFKILEVFHHVLFIEPNFFLLLSTIVTFQLLKSLKSRNLKTKIENTN